jgi:hypothetical protein
VVVRSGDFSRFCHLGGLPVKTLLKKLKTHRKGAKNAKKFKGKFKPILKLACANEHFYALA